MGAVSWISRIGFKTCAFVLKLQVPSEMEEKQTARCITVAPEKQAVNMPEVGTSQMKAQSFGSSWHIAYLRHDVSSCIAISNAVQTPNHQCNISSVFHTAHALCKHNKQFSWT